MRHPRPLPSEFGVPFTVRQAQDAGIPRGRLRRSDLLSPFHGIRATPDTVDTDGLNMFEKQAAERNAQTLRYAPRLRPGQFISHATAAAVLGAPLPLVFDQSSRRPEIGANLPVHVSTLGDGPLVRAAGVHGHRADPRVSRVLVHENIAVASPATTWGQLGRLSVTDLVAVGDFFCRVWRAGPGRPTGRRPLATVDELRAQLAHGRRLGIHRLRTAVELIREDSWSARESQLRCIIVSAGLPEPRLNQDVYDENGRFLGCVDLAYPELKVAIEYHGTVHAERYARDVERVAALRAAGWTVIEVTNELYRRRDELIRRIRAVLR